jgi:hypothetical protein
MLTNASEFMCMIGLHSFLIARGGLSEPTLIEWVDGSLLACFRERVLVVVLRFFGVGLVLTLSLIVVSSCTLIALILRCDSHEGCNAYLFQLSRL